MRIIKGFTIARSNPRDGSVYKAGILIKSGMGNNIDRSRHNKKD